MRKRIYIAGPITRGSMVHNVRQADVAFARLVKAGFAPFCPHWSVFHASIRDRLGEPIGKARVDAGNIPHEDWLAIDFEWLRVSAALLRLPGDSVGADKETAWATQWGVPVYHSVDELILAMTPAEA